MPPVQNPPTDALPRLRCAAGNRPYDDMNEWLIPVSDDAGFNGRNWVRIAFDRCRPIPVVTQAIAVFQNRPFVQIFAFRPGTTRSRLADRLSDRSKRTPRLD